jgi:hypothetical protein
VKDLYKENYTLLKKEIEEDYRKLQAVPDSQISQSWETRPYLIEIN